MPTVILALRAP